MSASKTPALQPILASVTAKLAVIVDFPTPPLPEDTAIIFSIPSMGFPLMVCSGLAAATTLVLILIFAFS